MIVCAVEIVALAVNYWRAALCSELPDLPAKAELPGEKIEFFQNHFSCTSELLLNSFLQML